MSEVYSFPCVCGHSRINHNFVIYNKFIKACGVEWCQCNKFIADNLKYLEILSESV